MTARIFLLALTMLLLAHPASAQSPKTPPVSTALHHEIGFFSGPFLISEAQEILPTVGGRFSLAMKRSHLELQAFGSNSGGVSYYLGELNWRKEFRLKQWSGLFLLGLDYHYFRGKSSSDYSTDNGFHIGTGLNVPLARHISFRNDYVYRIGVFKALTVTLGLSISFGGSGK